MADIRRRRLIGETRLATLEQGRLAAMRILRDGDGVQAGDRIAARLAKKLGARGIAQAGDEELLVAPWPAGVTEGATVELEVTRAAWKEPGRDRLAKARPARPAATKPEPAISDIWPDDLDEQWDAAFEAAELGVWPFAGGRLILSPTPAFLAVDVDGDGADLATGALQALAQIIRLWGLGGSIVIDVPHAAKEVRQQAAAGFDRAMAGHPFERTGINGFGLMQIVAPRAGPSLLERARLDRAGSDAVRLLEAARRDGGTGPMRLVARPGLAGWIESRPHLLAELARATGRPVDVRAMEGAGGGHVEAR